MTYSGYSITPDQLRAAHDHIATLRRVRDIAIARDNTPLMRSLTYEIESAEAILQYLGLPAAP